MGIAKAQFDRPPKPAARSSILRNGLFGTLVAGLAFVGYCSVKFNNLQQRSAEVAVATTSPPPPQLVMPTGEALLCKSMEGYLYRDAEMKRTGANQVKLSRLRTERAKALKTLVQNSKSTSIVGTVAVAGWVGSLQKLTTTSDRKAAVVVKLPCLVLVKTWNNGLSDVSKHTLIPSETPLYTQLTEMRARATVVFDGDLFPDRDDGLRETSATESGSMSEPGLLFRFKTIAAK